MHVLIIPHTLPGLNDYIRVERGHKQKAARIKKQLEQNIGWEIRRQLPSLRLNEPVFIQYHWWEPNRRRDKDNIAWAKKLIQDSLVKCRVLEGDGWAHIVGYKDIFAVDTENPHVEVKILRAGEVVSCEYCGQAII